MTELYRNLTTQLKRDEGEVVKGGRHVAYQDHLGFWTIGIGRLIDERRGGGLSESEALFLLDNDIKTRLNTLEVRLDFFHTLSDARKGVLLNMAFQLGVNGLMNFRNTLNHIRNKDFDKAATEMLNSNWARQTPNRARRLSNQMRTNQWQ